jgi:hypothetical protein
MARNEGLAPSIENMISVEYLFMSPKCCIFKTPVILSRHNEKAYIPNAFSIGPFHHCNPNLKATEKIKAKYLQGLISRSPSPETKLRDLINSIKAMEGEARDCYAGPIDCSPKLVDILVMDGCFIIELFRKNAYKCRRELDDPVFTMACMLQFLYHDLILLENQVPWMVLEGLFNMTIDPIRENKPLTQLAIEFFSNIFSSTDPGIVPPIQDIKHILDLLREWLVLSTREQEESTAGWQLMPCATSLVEAGIKFRRGKSTRSIMDIKFIDGVLEILPLLIQETTETVFRNLISFEQCFPNCEARFTSYAILLDNLINTVKDMDILCENEIIDNWLNPEDAVQFFNKLYHNAYVKEYYYLRLCSQVDEFRQRRWPRWRAVLVRNYFNTPWAILSTLVAFILVVLTFLQTIYSMKQSS